MSAQQHAPFYISAVQIYNAADEKLRRTLQVMSEHGTIPLSEALERAKAEDKQVWKDYLDALETKSGIHFLRSIYSYSLRDDYHLLAGGESSADAQACEKKSLLALEKIGETLATGGRLSAAQTELFDKAYKEFLSASGKINTPAQTVRQQRKLVDLKLMGWHGAAVKSGAGAAASFVAINRGMFAEYADTVLNSGLASAGLAIGSMCMGFHVSDKPTKHNERRNYEEATKTLKDASLCLGRILQHRAELSETTAPSRNS